MILKQGATYRYTQNGVVRSVIIEEIVVYMSEGVIHATVHYSEPAFNAHITESAEAFLSKTPTIIYY